VSLKVRVFTYQWTFFYFTCGNINTCQKKKTTIIHVVHSLKHVVSLQLVYKGQTGSGVFLKQTHTISKLHRFNDTLQTHIHTPLINNENTIQVVSWLSSWEGLALTMNDAVQEQWPLFYAFVKNVKTDVNHYCDCRTSITFIWLQLTHFLSNI